MYENFMTRELLLQDWFFDIIINFLRSPRWKTPIMSFLDDNCLVFDNEEENKLEYTQIHNVCQITQKLKSVIVIQKDCG